MNKHIQPAAEASPAIQRVPWNPWLGVVFIVVIFYASQIFGSLIVSIYPLLRRWSSARSAAWLNNTIAAQFIFVLLAEATVVGLIYLFLKKGYKLRLSAIGLKRPRWRDVGYGLLAVLPYYLLYFVTVGVVSHFVPSLNVNQQQDVGFNSVHGAVQLAMAFISLVILPPLAEEIMARGFLYSSFKKALPVFWAALLTSLMFAAPHLQEGGSAGPLYIAGLDTFVLSLVLISLREATGSLWSSITLHAVKNGVAFVALYVIHVH
jgi:membrane protease YdiL (CAAX protease family)